MLRRRLRLLVDIDLVDLDSGIKLAVTSLGLRVFTTAEFLDRQLGALLGLEDRRRDGGTFKGGLTNLQAIVIPDR